MEQTTKKKIDDAIAKHNKIHADFDATCTETIAHDIILAKQAEALVKEGDIFWAISTSGNSPSVVSAAKLAKKKEAKILAFTGKTGSKLEELADICFCANSDSPCRSQEIHQVAYHIICGLVEQSFCEVKG